MPPTLPPELMAAAGKVDDIIGKGKKPPEGEMAPEMPLAEEPPPVEEPTEEVEGEIPEADIKVFTDITGKTPEEAEKLLKTAQTFPKTAGMSAKEVAKWCMAYENFSVLSSYAAENEPEVASSSRLWNPGGPGPKSESGGGRGKPWNPMGGSPMMD